MHRRTFLGLLVGGSFAVAVGVMATTIFLRQPPLNLILVTLDTTRADHLGCYGFESAQTPTLDEWATGGVLFERAYATCPLTLPSHASIFTGLYPPEHGLHLNGRGRLGDEIPVLAELLRKAGYRTGAFVAAFVLDSKFGLDRGFDAYDDALSPEDGAGGDSAHRRRDGSSVMDAALAWIANTTSRPFFCWIHLYDAHFPYDARPAHFGNDFVSSPYQGGIAYLDLQLARLKGLIRRQRLSEHTLIIVVGDHGEGLEQHGEHEHGLMLYDSTLRVPLIAFGSKLVKPGHRVAEAVPLVDVMPTMLHCAGIPPKFQMSGHSLKTALEGNGFVAHACFAEADVPFVENGWAPLRALISGRFKYILTTRDELYDVVNDSHETGNLVDVPHFRPDRERLSGELKRWIADMVPRNAEAVHLSSNEQRVLASLGYAGGVAARTPSASEPSLPDVKDMLVHCNALHEIKSVLETNPPASATRLVSAVHDTEAILAKAPEYVEARIVLGRLLMRQQRFREAQDVFENVVADRPDDGATHAHLANALAGQGNLAEAVLHFRRAISLPSMSDHPQLHLNLARVLHRLGDKEEAIVECEEAVRLDPLHVDSHAQLGDFLLEAGRVSDAISQYEAALKCRPDFVPARISLGKALVRANRHQEALVQLSRAVEFEPNSFDARRSFGVLLLLSHRNEEAVTQLKEAARLRPEDPTIKDLIQKAGLIQH